MSYESHSSGYEKASSYQARYPDLAEQDELYRQNSAFRHWPIAAFLLLVVLLGLGILCWAMPDKWLSVERMDKVAITMPFEAPLVGTPTPFAGVPLPPENVQKTLRQRRAFFAGNFEFLNQSLSQQRQQTMRILEGSIGYDPFTHSLEDTALAGVDRCEQWLQAMPASYVAHWVCAQMWSEGAWEARSERFASDINIAQSVLMTERLQLSNQLLERALTLDDKPAEALTLLAHNHFLLGTRAEESSFTWSRLLTLFDENIDSLVASPHPRTTGAAARYLEQALAVAPRYLPAHRIRANFLQAKWGGTETLVLDAIEQARRAGIAEPDLHDMSDEFVFYPTAFSTPGATQAYWEKAISQQPTRKRLEGLMHDQAGRENWKAVVPAAEALIADFPDDSGAYYWMAEAKKMLGHTEEARAAHLYAAAMGHDGATQNLIMAFIRGGLGIDENYTGPSLPALCEYSAALGSAIGANCLGAGYFEGGQPGVPFASNPAQGYAWHLLASRAGHYNSQFDLGWMLYSGRVPQVDREQARALGVFWLRRAEEKQHTFAARRLDELNVDRGASVVSRDNLFVLKNAIKTQIALWRQRLSSLWA